MKAIKAYAACFCTGAARCSGGESESSVSVGRARMKCRWP